MNNQIITIQGVQCYEKDGIAYLNLEAVARGLGFTYKAASGNEVVRWNRVNEYLNELRVVATCGDGEKLPEYIPENIFYRLCMKAKNAVAEAFQAKVADEIIPAIRKTGAYLSPVIDSAMLFQLKGLDFIRKTVSLARASHKR